MLKKFFVLTLVTSMASQAAQLDTAHIAKVLHNQALRADIAAAEVSPTRDLITWQVGDYHDLVIDFLIPGSGKKNITKEETFEGAAAVWYVTEMSLFGQSQKSESLIRRADGKVLKQIVNGQPQNPDEGGEIEVIEQGETSVTVPAGTFDCVYIKAKTKQQGQESVVELWANPVDVNIDGMLQLKLETQMGPLTMKLKAFGHR